MNKKLMIAAALVFSLGTSAQATERRPFAYNGDAQAHYLQGKLEKSKLSEAEIMRFVANVFNFNDLNDKESEIAWKRAADAAIALADGDRARFSYVDCLAGRVIGGLVIITPKNGALSARHLPLYGNYGLRLGALRGTAKACQQLSV